MKLVWHRMRRLRTEVDWGSQQALELCRVHFRTPASPSSIQKSCSMHVHCLDWDRVLRIHWFFSAEYLFQLILTYIRYCVMINFKFAQVWSVVSFVSC